MKTIFNILSLVALFYMSIVVSAADTTSLGRLLCPNLFTSDFKLSAGKDSTITPNIDKPMKGERIAHPYNTCLVRATDYNNEPPRGFSRNHYSRRQPFNSNETYFLSYAKDGYWHLYNANNLKYIKKLKLGGADVEPQWSPTDPDILFKLPMNGGLIIQKYNVLTDKTATVADFRNVVSIDSHPGSTNIKDIWPTAGRVWTRSEGSPSKDARYWGFQVETNDFKPLGLITFDLEKNMITGVYDFDIDGGGIGRPDHVSMSPSGKYIVSSWYHQKCTEIPGTTNNPCGLMSYTRDFTTGVSLSERGEHSDIALDKNGNDIVIMSNYVNGYVEMYNLNTGKTTRLWRIYIGGSATAMHFSGKSYNKPGWVLVSTYATGGSTQWWTNKIMAVELKSNPKIYILSHTFNIDAGYWSEPHAVVNRNFTKILFNSNWLEKNENTDIYMISLPIDAIQ